MSRPKQEVGHPCPTQSMLHAIERTSVCKSNPNARTLLRRVSATLIPRDRAARPFLLSASVWKNHYKKQEHSQATRGKDHTSWLWPCHFNSLLSNFTIQTSLFAILLLLAPCAFAGPNREVSDANALYAMGQFQEALDIYTRLAKQQPENAELQFNQGAAQFQLGNLDKAKSAFESAGQQSKDTKLQALATYNIGNCDVQTAQTQAEKDPKKAVADLVDGVRHYKDALTRDPELTAAAHNLEMARRAIQRLREQMKEQQKQQQEQQKKQDEAKEKLDELIKKQEQNNQKSQEASEKKEDPAQPDPSQEEMNKQADQQKSTREDTEELAKSMDHPQDSADPSPMDEAKKHAEKAADKQQEAEEDLRNQDPQKAQEAQKEALDELKQAKETLDKSDKSKDEKPQGDPADKDADKKDKGEPSDSEKNADAQQKQPPPSEEQKGETEDMQDVPPPDATARDILNQEKKNKAQRKLRQMVRIRPVEKDW